MEVDSRMHAAAFLPTYPQHIFDSLTVSSRDFFPLNSHTTTSHAYMPSTQGHPSLPSSHGYSAYVAGGLGGRFRGDPSQFAGVQPSMHLNMHNQASTSSQRYPGASQMHHSSSLQHHMHSPQPSSSAAVHSLSLPALGHHHQSTASHSQSMQVPQTVPIMSAHASSRDTRRSPLGGEAERAPQAAYLYEQSRMMPTSPSLSLLSSQSWNGVGGSSSSGTRLPPILQVEKQQVTTSATQAASASRRRNEANFQCPVPGCGSTFTRRFNLRGHLRSHTEERPFVCEWPGCGKGFARQHDCKRHQALHASRSQTSNVCQGCGKTFSRLDALNRHLRSEGGSECRQTADAVAIAARLSPNEDEWEDQSNDSDRKASPPQ